MATALDLGNVMGNRWIAGTGVPQAAGNIGDMYLDTDTGNVYQCTAAGAAGTAVWTLKGNLKGATGETGQDGSTLLNGAGDPGEEDGNDGDYYLDTEGGRLFLKSNGAWGDPIMFFATEGAVVDSQLSGSSEHPVQNKVVTAALGLKVDTSSISNTPANETYIPFSTKGALALQNRIAEFDTVKPSDNSNNVSMGDAAGLTFAHSGTYSSTHQVRKYGKIAFLNISAQGGTAWIRVHNEENPIVAILPSGYYPKTRQYFFGRIGVNGTTCHCGIWVETNGRIRLANVYHASDMKTTSFTRGAKITSVQLNICYEVA